MREVRNNAIIALTSDLPGTEGELKCPADFLVEEIPAYLPSGDGEHCLVEIEKTELTTEQAINRICKELSLNSLDVGYAGLKDKWAITRQWLSFSGVRPEDLLKIQLPNIRVLNAGLHNNKLRTGHLRGNRFVITLRGVVKNAKEYATNMFNRLAQTGLPNFFGPQRFGLQGNNVTQGLLLLRGEGKGPRRPRERRLIISAVQSRFFNEVLAKRIEQKNIQRMIGGDVLQFVGKSTVFVSEDQTNDQIRVDNKELVITGPICGPRMPRPKDKSPAALLEQEIFANNNVTPEQFGSFGRLARGGRRPLVVFVEQVSVEQVVGAEDDFRLELKFTLPKGTYATVLLGEITKNESFDRRDGS